MVIVFLFAGVAGAGYLLRSRRSFPKMDPGLVGNRGWLLLAMVGLAAELAHGLALTVGSLIVYADPSLAGLGSFIPLWGLVIYVVGNLGLLVYGLVLFRLMLSKRRAAIAHAIVFNALSVAFLVAWFLLGAKSPVGTIIDSLPGIAAIAYFSRSQRVRNTYTALLPAG